MLDKAQAAPFVTCQGEVPVARSTSRILRPRRDQLPSPGISATPRRAHTILLHRLFVPPKLFWGLPGAHHKDNKLALSARSFIASQRAPKIDVLLLAPFASNTLENCEALCSSLSVPFCKILALSHTVARIEFSCSRPSSSLFCRDETPLGIRARSHRRLAVYQSCPIVRQVAIAKSGEMQWWS
jgi:hypothetical protein